MEQVPPRSESTMQEQQEKYPNDWPVITPEQERVKLGLPAVPPMPGMPEQTPRPKRRIGRWIVIGLVGFIGLGIIGSALSGGSTSTTTSGASAPAVTVPTAPAYTPPTTQAAAPTKAPKAKPEFTVSQQNAIASAQSYLDYEAFSRLGLIGQLSSKYGEGFSKEDATFAVDHITVDWNEQAAKSAKSYLKYQSFSRNGLIQQLESPSGEQFTHAQAVYGVEQTGL